jgi:hypothetical protein
VHSVIYVSETPTRALTRDVAKGRTMTTNGSATIYQFPARGRFAASDHRAVNSQRGDAKPADRLAPAQAVSIAVDSGWYHDEAIRDAERTRKN